MTTFKKEEESSFKVLEVKFDGTLLKPGSQLKGLYCRKDGVSPFYTLEEILSKKGHIICVENGEGNVFKLGDYVKTDRVKSTIIGFKQSTDKQAILAITQVHKNGVNINKLEHWIPKMDLNDKKFNSESEVLRSKNDLLLEKARQHFPKGTTFISVLGNMFTSTSEPNFNQLGDIVVDVFEYIEGNVIIYLGKTEKWATPIIKKEIK